MRIQTILPGVVLCVALLSGCSQGGAPDAETAPVGSTATSSGTASVPGEGGQEPTAAAPSDATLSATATKLNCAEYALAGTVAPGAAEYGTCQLDGVRVQLYRFANLDDKQVFLDQVKAYGVVESQLAVSNDGLIAAAPADQRLLAQLQETLRS